MTIFVSTHFMNEAERCDRISLMDAGRVLATGTPAALIAARGAATLEDAFIAYLERRPVSSPGCPRRCDPDACRPARRRRPRPAFGACSPIAMPRKPGALRDRVRLGFALFGTAVADAGLRLRHQHRRGRLCASRRSTATGTPESRAYLKEFAGSRYFVEQPPIADGAELRAAPAQRRAAPGDRDPARLRSRRDPRPAGRGRRLDRRRHAVPRRNRARLCPGGDMRIPCWLALVDATVRTPPPATIEIRFRYNQDFNEHLRHGASHASRCCWH